MCLFANCSSYNVCLTVVAIMSPFVSQSFLDYCLSGILWYAPVQNFRIVLQHTFPHYSLLGLLYILFDIAENDRCCYCTEHFMKDCKTETPGSDTECKPAWGKEWSIGCIYCCQHQIHLFLSNADDDNVLHGLFAEPHVRVEGKGSRSLCS